MVECGCFEARCVTQPRRAAQLDSCALIHALLKGLWMRRLGQAMRTLYIMMTAMVMVVTLKKTFVGVGCIEQWVRVYFSATLRQSIVSCSELWLTFAPHQDSLLHQAVSYGLLSRHTKTVISNLYSTFAVPCLSNPLIWSRRLIFLFLSITTVSRGPQNASNTFFDTHKNPVRHFYQGLAFLTCPRPVLPSSLPSLTTRAELSPLSASRGKEFINISTFFFLDINFCLLRISSMQS